MGRLPANVPATNDVYRRKDRNYSSIRAFALISPMKFTKLSPVKKSFLALCALTLTTAPLLAEDVSVKDYPDGTGVRNLSPAPAPGLHPRIFLSPEDLPAFREAVLNSGPRKLYYAQLKKIVADNLDAPGTPGGKVMALLAEGKTPSDAEFAAVSEHMSYWLLLAGIDCTVTNDQARGEKLAAALNAWGKYQLAHWVRQPDPVGLHNSFDYEMCIAYDFIAPWMKEEQRVPVRQMIAKMMDGIHIFTWNMPPRWRMWNWAALHVYQGTGSLAIEGEPGYTPQLWDETRMVVKDVGRYNVHPGGALTEDLTYFTLGFEGTGMAMVAMAKRGEQDVWDTSNVSKLKYHLINQLYPWGGEFQSHADGVGSGFYTSFTIWKYMYPKDPIIDYTWRNRVGENYENGGPGNDVGIRSWVVPLLGTDHFPQPVTAAELNQPLTYFSPERGYLIARTGWDKDALKLDFEAKQDYPIMGHNHADANNFNLDALGRMWVTDTGYHGSGGNQHNEVMIDGVPESPWPAPGGHWVDLVNTPDVVIGVSDAKHAYDYHWSDTGYSKDNNPPPDKEKWEKETQPEVAAFYAGQENRKTTGIFDHWSPFLLRSVWNPVQRAFRTASLVRGPHPYVFIVDDIQKDYSSHLYQWIQQMPDDVEILKTGGDWVVLGAKNMPSDPKDKNAKPVPDNRRLLVRLVDVDATDHASAMAIQLETFISDPNTPYASGPIRKRLTIPARGVNPRYKVLLYPFMEGAELPEISWNQEHNQCKFTWKDQADQYTFATAASGRTVYRLARDNKTLATLNAPPAAPVVLSQAQVFVDRTTVEFENPGPGQEIHYTLDGSAPTMESPFYSGPIRITKSVAIKAVNFARAWDFGNDKASSVVEVKLKQEAPLAALSNPDLKAGLKASVYQGYWDNLPEFSQEKPIAETTVDRFVLPPETPVKGFGVMLKGCVQVPTSGVYTFALKCDDAGKLSIDGHLVVDADGPHVVETRTGQIALAAGWHRISVGNCDNALPHGKGKGDGSWAFSVMWAPPFAGGLAEIPADLLSQESAGFVARIPGASVQAQAGLISQAGLECSDYNQAAFAGKPEFFNVSSAEPISDGCVPSVETPDSSPNLLHVYRGFLKIAHDGVYEFRLPSSGLGEILLGTNVVERVGIDEANVSHSIQLEHGAVPITVKLARGDGLIQWRGPGMDWQAVQAQDWLRPARPSISVNGRETGQSQYEVPSSQKVDLVLPQALDGCKIHYTLDGSRPGAQSPGYASSLSIDHDCELQALAFDGGNARGDVSHAKFKISKEPTQGLMGIWQVARFQGSAITNSVKSDAAGALPVPAGTSVVDDPQFGKVLQLDQCPRLALANLNILKNELTISFRIKPSGKGTLVRYGYANRGFSVELSGNSGVHANGGGSWTGAATPSDVLDSQKWHHVTVTLGKSIAIYIDGRLQASKDIAIPCITDELEFLEGFTGQLSEIRMYNRVLNSDEIAALANEAPAK